MKRKLVYFMALMMFLMVKNVNASSYYYVNDEGLYMLCAEHGGCISISQNEEKATFDLFAGMPLHQPVGRHDDAIHRQPHLLGFAHTRHHLRRRRLWTLD